ncbi:transcription elongation factor Spt5 [Candidatus Woesearchaeota archaeon]|nr:MAG: transcriptional antiterminator NusG [archaeon GW2011_AR4]MBS3130702.1 transcription elongation factor Spt5 [Candidatus Woesearchaeota archaeon]HIH38835.1 transcription elongation factor Spt5 [Candidatus Woesearchaeota archaeon]HIH48904.1 transcription elongation factor Spt5 [Candidatus Woesearchaeota archaeon]HIJ04342.1 transcription elongation factor Spt5 [Candidatus Woesearchaeota archaeon]
MAKENKKDEDAIDSFMSDVDEQEAKHKEDSTGKQQLPEMGGAEEEEIIEVEFERKEDDILKDIKKKPRSGKKEKEEVEEIEKKKDNHIYSLRTTANREDQVMDFIVSNAKKKGIALYSIIRPHGMRGYIFLEAETRADAEQAAFGVPYARGILPDTIAFKEIEHMLDKGQHEVDIRKNDICEIIAGPFKREKAKITRIDKQKEEIVVELLEAAVPIPITVKMDSVRVIRREGEEEDAEE